MDRPSVTFGRRGAAPAPRNGATRPAPADPMRTESGIPVSELAARLGLGPGSFGTQDAPAAGQAAAGPLSGGTPVWSFGASLIAGLATSGILTVATVFQATHGPHGANAASGDLLGLSSQQVLLAAVLGGLFSAGQAGGIALPIVHALLRRLGTTQIPAYALGCGAVAAGLTFVPVVGGSDGLTMAAAGGVLTGFFFRLFARRR